MDPDLIDRIRGAAHVPAAEFDVEILARRARRRRWWRRTGQVTAVVAALVGVGLGASLLQRGPDQEMIVAPPGPSPLSAGAANRVNAPLVPRTYVEGDSVVMPITMPDGTTAEIVYPRKLDLAGLGVRPYATTKLIGCCGGEILGDDAWLPEGGESYFARHGPPVNQFQGAGGRPVREWKQRVVAANTVVYRVLTFRFGRWHLAIGFDDSVGERERKLWAKNLQGRVTEDGFLVLHPRPPLHLDGPDFPVESKYGPVGLAFGESGSPDPYIEVTPLRDCTPTAPQYQTSNATGATVHEVEFCRDSVHFLGYGDADFVRALAHGVQVRSVDLAGD